MAWPSIDAPAIICRSWHPTEDPDLQGDGEELAIELDRLRSGGNASRWPDKGWPPNPPARGVRAATANACLDLQPNRYDAQAGAKKNALFEAIVLTGKAFASPRRLELLDLLAQAPRTVDELTKASEQSTANTSQHLQALHAAGMVTRAREGTSVRYSLAGEEALCVWLALRDASVARLAEVERAAREYLGEEVDAIGREELIERLQSGDVVLVDVRPSEEFAAGHIDGARSIPLDELQRRLAELPADREVVAYCRGPFCAYAHEAVRQLHAAGRDARRLEEGWPEWRLHAA